jgi:uncharacterized protein
MLGNEAMKRRRTSPLLPRTTLGLLITLFFTGPSEISVDACQVCQGSVAPLLSINFGRCDGSSFAALDSIATQPPFMQKHPFLFANGISVMTPRRRIFMTNGDEKENGDQVQPEDQGNAGKPKEEAEDGMSTAMIASIGFYKNVISPLLPPACRFVPTCSQYGVQAIKEFGPTKGTILIVWRLLRCSPIGGKGYDPPKWPPVSYTYSSYF